eukprot:TRINITY_DN794_c0_g1_i1.p1 TRINITY_DN794_c0_g1~~TRINITY_DN794_c0_g1_i1.p1  ORF type:complete len:643 (-),score=160.85 TRINITY_DN794_c0_g1_i1:66-1994(-)
MDQNGNKGGDAGGEQVVIIEEKIAKTSGEFTVKRYMRGKLLGKGGFAKCYEVNNLETKKTSAAKIIVKSSLTKSRARQKLISEIKIHRSLHNTNVVSFEHVFEDQENVYILLEMCTNQTLNELIKRRKRLTEIEVQCYLSQLINGLKYLHSNRVIHRDLKLGNLFLSDKMELKMGDFGLATKLEFDGEKKRTICGTPNYIAPEILEGKNGHSYEVDIWSLGVILYALLIGKPPFETPDVKTTYKKIRMNSYSFPEHVPISDAAKSLIQKILVLDPTQRPTLDEILEHPFLNNGGTIPKLLPLSTLACPPSASYIRQFQPQGNTFKMAPNPKRVGETQAVDVKPGTSKPAIGTERVSLSKQGTMNMEGQYKGFGNEEVEFNPGTTNNLQTKDFRPNTTGPQGAASPKMPSQMGTIQRQSQNSMGQTGKPSYKSEIYVTKWVDYSSKYGLGYLLSNGSTGVYFNDSTKIVLEPNGTYFEYIERRQTDKQDMVVSHTLNDYPKELQKKVTLIQHFKIYLEAENKETAGQGDLENKGEPLVFVKKWMKTKHAIMFRLSNKIVQVDFKDKTEIILSSESKTVTYVNKKGERSHYPLATALESTNQEMTKRLKYTKEILTQMLNANQAPANPLEGGNEKLQSPFTERQ